MKSYHSKIQTFEAALSFVFWGIVAAFAVPLALMTGAIMNIGHTGSFDSFGLAIGGAVGFAVGYVVASFVTGLAYVLLDINQKLGASPEELSDYVLDDDEDESQMSDREKALKRFAESKGYE